MAEQPVVRTFREPVDAVVVGMGPGGGEVAARLADAGLDVLGVDRRLLGGECPYFGCLPTKTMLRAAALVADGHRIPGMAGTARVSPSWRPVARHVREAATDWSDKTAVDRFTARGGRFLRGSARITAPGEVSVVDGDDCELIVRPTRAIVLATGGVPAVPPVPGLAGTPYWTNREAVAAEAVPESLVVLGGGPTGLELAQVFARFGAGTTVLEAAGRLLPTEEPEAGELLLHCLSGQGLTVRVGAEATSVAYEESGLFVVGTGRGDVVGAERLLVAAGRRVDADALGLGGAYGVRAEGGAIPVDDRMRVVPPVGSRPGVWAVGDAVGRGGYTHAAVAEAEVAVRGVLGEGGPPLPRRTAVPRTVFTDPEVGAVGLTEAQAVRAGIAVRAAVADVASSARGRTWGPGAEGFVKLVADTGAGVLVGATAAGPLATEVLGVLTLAVQARVPLDELKRTVWAYPSFHRVVGEAVASL